MNTRLVLVKLTADSMEDHPGADWHHRVRDMITDIARDERVGAESVELFWTLGPYDAVVRIVVPSDAAAVAFSLTLGRKLRAATITLTELTEADMDVALQVTEGMNGPLRAEST
jgi:uncharacterized protein with GYD domain